MRTIKEILGDYRSTLACVKEENATRERIKASPEYVALQETMEGLLEGVHDSSDEHQADKAELITYMQDNDLRNVEEFEARGRRIRSVDTYAVLRAMEGDMDNLMLVASIKFKDLDKFCKENPEYKGNLRSCIIEEGYKIIDIVLSTPPEKS